MVYILYQVEENKLKKCENNDTEDGEYKKNVTRKRKDVIVQHIDIIGNNFWTSNPQILSQ